MDPNLIRRYESEGGAAAYRTKYERSLSRRLSNRRELSLVDRALRDAGARGRLLDCPCGAGRLVPVALRHADHVTGADLSTAMVEEARDALSVFVEAGRVDLTVASVDDLPFEDDAFDTVVCHRLIHHVADAEERARMLREIARVATRRVVLSFADASTPKRRWQERRNRTHRRIALQPEALAREAADEGLTLLGSPRRLNGLFSLVAVAVLAVDGRENAR